LHKSEAGVEVTRNFALEISESPEALKRGNIGVIADGGSIQMGIDHSHDYAAFVGKICPMSMIAEASESSKMKSR
jgi:hypothetical protein